MFYKQHFPRFIQLKISIINCGPHFLNNYWRKNKQKEAETEKDLISESTNPDSLGKIQNLYDLSDEGPSQSAWHVVDRQAESHIFFA